MTERQFFDNLRKKGYEVKIGKDISVRPPGKERFVRLIRNFGEDYSIEQIRRRILSQTRAEKKPSEPTRQVIRIRLFGSLKKTRKITGFRALYFHYCYLLGIFPKNKPKQNRRRLHFLLREDLRKLDDITAETRLLVRNRIDTAEQLFSYRDEAQDKSKAQCVSYILGKEFGVDVSGYAFEAPADFLRTDDPQTIRAELTDIRDTAYDISARMMRSLEQNKAPRQSEQER